MNFNINKYLALKHIWNEWSVSILHMFLALNVSTFNTSSPPWVSDMPSISISLVSNQDDSVVHSFSAASNKTISVWAPSWSIESNWNCFLSENAEVRIFALGDELKSVSLNYSLELNVSALLLDESASSGIT